MGIRHLLLLLIYLDPMSVLSAATGAKKAKTVPKRTPKPKEANVTAAVPTAVPQVQPDHDKCRGYYDVSGQYDKEFSCNNTEHRYCCGTCFLRFCCQYKKDRIDQNACKNYHTPNWVITAPPSPVPTGDAYDPSMDQTNTAVYITCGIIAFIIVLGVSVKVAYDKATEPPQEMNIHRALADILRQQGPIPISQYDCENFAAMNGSPKDNTPIRTSSKNHYTPVHASKSNHGLHYGKESVRSSGGHDLHNFISSGFVTLGRGHPKGTHQHSYNHVALGSPTRTPKNAHRSLRRENTHRMSAILTSQTEPYDLSFSRSFQSLSHLPPSYEVAAKADLSRFSSLKKLSRSTFLALERCLLGPPPCLSQMPCMRTNNCIHERLGPPGPCRNRLDEAVQCGCCSLEKDAGVRGESTLALSRLYPLGVPEFVWDEARRLRAAREATPPALRSAVLSDEASVP